MGQDWSEIWLQKFNGTVTIWPKSIPSDFYHILSDPSVERLARLIHVGQQSAFPKIQFIKNRLKIEGEIVKGIRQYSRKGDQLMSPLLHRRHTLSEQEPADPMVNHANRKLTERRSNYKDESRYVETSESGSTGSSRIPSPTPRRGSRQLLEEMRRQSAVFFDDAIYGEEDAVGPAE
jgi:hypothetical protein